MASGRRSKALGRAPRVVLAAVADGPLRRGDRTRRSRRRVAAIGRDRARRSPTQLRAATGSRRSARSTASASGGRATDATEEYEDALLERVRRGRAGGRPRRRSRTATVVLPWANLRRPTGERKATGLTGSLLAEPVEAPPPPTRVVVGPRRRRRGCPRRAARAEAPDGTPRSTRGAVAAAGASGPARARARAAGDVGRRPPPGATSAPRRSRPRAMPACGPSSTSSRYVRRPQIIARIRTAKEHGDLKENAEYHAAREEQSFLEGRVQAIEARLRSAVIVEAPAAGSRVGLGSVVTARRRRRDGRSTRSSGPTNPIRSAAGSRPRRRSVGPCVGRDVGRRRSSCRRRPASAATGSSTIA